MYEIQILFILFLLYFLYNKSEKFVSYDTMKEIEKKKSLFSKNVSYRNAVNGICRGKKCLDVVDHYKITKMYNNDPSAVTVSNLQRELRY
jgi:phosphoribosylformylglycinamidine (FGAM) synthase-like amidotransferase family enzyme